MLKEVPLDLLAIMESSLLKEVPLDVAAVMESSLLKEVPLEVAIMDFSLLKVSILSSWKKISF